MHAVKRDQIQSILTFLEPTRSRERADLNPATRHDSDAQIVPCQQPHPDEYLVADSRHENGSLTPVPLHLRSVYVEGPN